MPWKVERTSRCPASRPWGVVKLDDGSIEGCHETKEAANRQLAALNIAEAEMAQKRRRPPAHVRRIQRVARATVKATRGSLDWVRDQAWRLAGGEAFVREVFTDRVILERENGTLIERSWSIGENGDLVLGDPREVTLEYVAKAEGGPRLCGPFVAKDEAKRLVYGAVLVPGEPDSDGDVLSEEKIEEVAHEWLAAYRNIDVQHDVQQIDAVPVESYIEPQDREVEIEGEVVTLPAGTWTMAVKVNDDAAWEAVTRGELAGFSIMGVPTDQLPKVAEAVKSGDKSALKRTTLADLGDGDPNAPTWAVPFVSLVDRPAVPKAKFFAIKRAAGVADDQDNTEGVDMDMSKLTEAVKAAVDEVVQPLTERLDTIEKAAGKAEEPAKDSGEAGDQTAAKDDDQAAQKEGDGAGASGDGGKGGDGDGEKLSPAVLSAITAAVSAAVAPLAQKMDRVEKRTRPGSQQPGDGASEPVQKVGVLRDAYGRRIWK